MDSYVSVEITSSISWTSPRLAKCRIKKETDLEIAGAGEVLAVLVEGDGHHSVRRVEGLLHPITVVDVDVHVQDLGTTTIGRSYSFLGRGRGSFDEGARIGD